VDTYYDLSMVKISSYIFEGVNYLSYFILVIALFLYYMGITFKHNNLMLILVALNVILSFKEIYEIKWRYGIDYIAYVQQAGAVWMGERDYSKISSNLGPAFYPAGHLWHYIPVYALHLYTEDVEYIMKAVHIGIHCWIIVTVYLISCKYFAEEGDKSKTNSKAQLIAFILVTNPVDKVYYNFMFNDEIMIAYLLVAIY
jgi:hypothetical protein